MTPLAWQIPVSILACLGGIRILLAPYWIYRDRHEAAKRTEAALSQQVEDLQATPAKLDVKVRELASRSVDPRAADSSDIFLRARVELLEPQETRVTRYRLELSLHGQSESADSQDDVGEWQAQQWNTPDMMKYDLNPLAVELRRGEPIEGWLHFVSPTPFKLLERFAVRLIVQTSRGSGYAEYPADKLVWNPLRAVITKRKA